MEKGKSTEMSDSNPPSVLRLVPGATARVPIKGLYLSEALHRRGTATSPFVYANFLTSLDGRIAIEDDQGVPFLPKSLTTEADFRLFLELEAQADCLITHGGYLRALAEGRLGNILQVGAHPLGADLVQWRLQQGLPPQPAIVVASASLDFPLPSSIKAHDQPLYLVTGLSSDPQRVKAWRERGHEVLFAGKDNLVEGDALVRLLGSLGYRCLYLIAGPQMLDTMVRNAQLSLLFQTLNHQLMGGEAFRTLVSGPTLGVRGHMELISLYLDEGEGQSVGQFFAQFKPRCNGATS